VRWNIILTFAIKGIFIGLEVLERFGAVEPPGRRWSIQTEVTD
jgi:hypothetical protein